MAVVQCVASAKATRQASVLFASRWARANCSQVHARRLGFSTFLVTAAAWSSHQSGAAAASWSNASGVGAGFVVTGLAGLHANGNTAQRRRLCGCAGSRLGPLLQIHHGPFAATNAGLRDSAQGLGGVGFFRQILCSGNRLVKFAAIHSGVQNSCHRLSAKLGIGDVYGTGPCPVELTEANIGQCQPMPGEIGVGMLDLHLREGRQVLASSGIASVERRSLQLLAATGRRRKCDRRVRQCPALFEILAVAMCGSSDSAAAKALSADRASA